MERIGARGEGADRGTVRLLRRYAACRDVGEPVLPALTSLAAELGLDPTAGVAVASVFQLTEGCLGRRLATGSICRDGLTSDEAAVLALLRRPAAPAGGGAPGMPHGLPGALAWAVASARRLCGLSASAAGPVDACPFGAAGGATRC